MYNRNGDATSWQKGRFVSREGQWRAVLVVLGSEVAEPGRRILHASEFLGIKNRVAHIQLEGATNGVDLEVLSNSVARAFTLVTGKNTTCKFRRSDGRAKSRMPWPPRLGDDMTFEEFAVGPSNRLAHAAVMACAEARNWQFNPVVLTGEPGSGKTHLLQALAHRLVGRRRMFYMSAKQFIEVVSTASSEDALAELRAEFPSVEVLLFDDLHLLSDADGSREEFFTLMSGMLSSGRLLVAASDVSLLMLEKFEERLISRLHGGISFGLERPGLETRMAVTARMLEKLDLKVSEDIARFIAERNPDGRSIEDFANRLKIIANASKREVTLRHVRELLGGEETVPFKPSVDTVQSVVAEEFSITRADLNGKSRKQVVTWPRQIAMYLARELTSYSFVEIGGLFGGRDHSTVVHAVGKVTEALSVDSDLRNTVKALRRRISEESHKSGRRNP
jgi:chromosomal replication initiator protein